MLYRTGEHILIAADESTEKVILATDFFAICINGEYHNFIKGNLCDPTGDIHVYSGNPTVVPTFENGTFHAKNVKRKVMLYPEPENITNPSYYLVIDYCRQQIPLDIEDVIIPVYPVCNDMNGDDGDTWIAHVKAVNKHNKTCQVEFYIETSENIYTKEITGR